jgi:glucose dehydrogenase
MKRKAVIAALLGAGVVGVSAQRDWVQVGQDPGHTKYSTLDQINVDHVRTLQRAWSFHTGDKTGFFESTPLVIGDVMYVSAQNGVFALDPVTGAKRWQFETVGATRRGLGYWPGDAKTAPRLFLASGTRLIAVDTKTGKLALEFGDGGFVEMEAAMQSPPVIYKDVLIAANASRHSRLQRPHRRRDVDVPPGRATG